MAVLASPTLRAAALGAAALERTTDGASYRFVGERQQPTRQALLRNSS